MNSLIIMRAQPLHNGHCGLIYKALLESRAVTIVLGSSQEWGTINNPFRFEERRDMILDVFGASNKMNIVSVDDLGRGEKYDWINHVVAHIGNQGIPTPNRYYAGSVHDASWMKAYVEKYGAEIDISVVDRYSSGVMSATEIRKSIVSDCRDWERYVPDAIVDKIRSGFPSSLVGDV